MSSTSGPAIKHIIVVMLENRSYDNVLGWLYNPSNQPPYNQAPQGQFNLNGLTGEETNPPTQQGGAPIQVLNQRRRPTEILAPSTRERQFRSMTPASPLVIWRSKSSAQRRRGSEPLSSPFEQR